MNRFIFISLLVIANLTLLIRKQQNIIYNNRNLSGDVIGKKLSKSNSEKEKLSVFTFGDKIKNNNVNWSSETSIEVPKNNEIQSNKAIIKKIQNNFNSDKNIVK